MVMEPSICLNLIELYVVPIDEMITMNIAHHHQIDIRRKERKKVLKDILSGFCSL